MKISTRKIAWMNISCAVALLTGMPAVADDTELLLFSPDPSQLPPPNVMFIIDNSGSMEDQLTTTISYDSNLEYDGACDKDKFYWTDIDLEPDCATSKNVIDSDRLVCVSAQKQLDGIGSYTNTMIQYRDGSNDGSSARLWQTLAPGYSSAFVECLADSGIHGDGTDGTRLWASTGSNLDNLFTNNAKEEVAWGSSPRHISYTVYTGNYLNWKNNPQTDVFSKIDIVKDVATKVLSSVENINVGIMKFNFDDGGPVILGMTDLDQNRQQVLDTIRLLAIERWTPLSETMYEAALYWRGMPAYYGSGEIDGTSKSDSSALASSDPAVYQQPDWGVCSKNYNVLLTDGEPRRDEETTGLVGNLPNFGSALGYAGCDGEVLPEGGQCLDDIAEYLSVQDVDTIADGDQLVTTHTIGFDIDLPILQETADDSGGRYFQANDVASLTRTLLSIIGEISDRSLSFSAPAVSVNTFNRTQNLNDLYITTFGAKAKAHWPGNLKKYRITDGQIVDANGANAVDPATGFFLDSATSEWTTGGPDGNNVLLGGAAQQLPAPAARNLYTNNSGNDLTSAANSVTPLTTSLIPADFGLTGADGEPEMAELIDWARGADLRDEDGDPATTVRKAMGDPLHSQPATVVYGGDAQNPDVVVFTATNDGYLHAFDGDSGEELWAFIPKRLLSNLTRLYFDPNSKYKQYGIDGNIVPIVKDVDRDGIIESADGDFVQLIFGMRRGGSNYYSLDVTDRNSPRLLWNANLPEFGESWSSPVIARIDVGSVTQNTDKAVVVIGGGYNTVHDTSSHPVSPDVTGAGVHMLDLKTGAELWRAGADLNADLVVTNMTRAMPNEIRVIDFSGDGFADRMYASDLGGQVWRFDVFNGQAPATLVTGGVIARLGAEGLATPAAADTRRFYNAPDISLITDNNQQRRFISVSIGSGYRAHPFDLDASDRFFSIRDGDVFNQLPQSAYDNYPIITDDDLVEVSGQTQTVITANDRGWKFTLPYNQKVLADSLTFDNQIFFVAFSPDSEAAVSCTAGRGTNFLYRMSALNGDPVTANLEALSPEEADDARSTTLQQGGIAPTPTILFPSADDPDCEGAACTPPPLGCVGVECFDPGFANNPVRTLWTQDGIQ